MNSPVTGKLHGGTGKNPHLMNRHRDQFAMPVQRCNLYYGPAAVGVVKGYPFNSASIFIFDGHSPCPSYAIAVVTAFTHSRQKRCIFILAEKYKSIRAIDSPENIHKSGLDRNSND